MTEDLSTDEWVKLISDSVLNGQYTQAVDQFECAIKDSCNIGYLLSRIGEQIGPGRALIRVAAAYIERKKSNG